MGMTMRLLPLGLLLGGVAGAQPVPVGHQWSPEQLAVLDRALAAAADEGLACCATGRVTPASATAVALQLARAHLFGCAPETARAGWRIPGGDERYDLPAMLDQAMARQDLDGFFDRLRPRHRDYAALRARLKTETDPARRATLSLNMERWRWMPLDLGGRYLLANVPRFELTLWDNGRVVGNWRIIVGKPSTPTPVFAAVVTGVTYNPWWEVPQSIVRESVGRLTRTNPREARRRGFVWGDGRWRQRPGPANPLGVMKLMMPNPYSVFLHGTNAPALFDRPVRAFSHGCIRVEDAARLAATLLGRDRLAEAGGATTSFATPHPVPVYIAYFTASADPAGTVAYHPDLYRRDAGVVRATPSGSDCPPPLPGGSLAPQNAG